MKIKEFCDGLQSADLLIVGCGLYGMTIAERAANRGFKAYLIDRRSHIGGNTYSYITTVRRIK